MSEILLAGASGLIGSKLIKKLKQKNYKIVLLSTRKKNFTGIETLYWSPDTGVFPDLDLRRFSVCINFCGAGIFDKRFSDKRKELLISSRILPIEFLKKQFEIQKVCLPHFISASASGFYPNICLSPLHEDSTPGNGFISRLVRNWEEAARNFAPQSDRVTCIRIGIVLSEQGGFLKKLMTPIRYLVGAVPGDGKQMVSWIHVDDLCDLFIHVMENKLQGVYNAAAPQPETLSKITKETAKRMHRPLWLPNIPSFALKIIFGKDREELLQCSQQIESDKIRASGFKFQFPDLSSALNHLIP